MALASRGYENPRGLADGKANRGEAILKVANFAFEILEYLLNLMVRMPDRNCIRCCLDFCQFHLLVQYLSSHSLRIQTLLAIACGIPCHRGIGVNRGKTGKCSACRGCKSQYFSLFLVWDPVSKPNLCQMASAQERYMQQRHLHPRANDQLLASDLYFCRTTKMIAMVSVNASKTI